MSIMIVAIAFSALVSGAHSQSTNGSDSIMENHALPCLTKRNMTEEQFVKLADENDPVVGCVLACMLENAGVLKDGTFDKTKAIELFQERAQDKAKDVDKTKLAEKLDECISGAKMIAEPCGKSLIFVGCTEENIMEWMRKEYGVPA